MSHLDDVEPIFWNNGPGPKGLIGLVFVALAIAALVWAVAADEESKDTCKRNGEKYVDSRAGYTLCEGDGGVVIKR